MTRGARCLVRRGGLQLPTRLSTYGAAIVEPSDAADAKRRGYFCDGRVGAAESRASRAARRDSHRILRAVASVGRSLGGWAALVPRGRASEHETVELVDGMPWVLILVWYTQLVAQCRSAGRRQKTVAVRSGVSHSTQKYRERKNARPVHAVTALSSHRLNVVRRSSEGRAPRISERRWETPARL